MIFADRVDAGRRLATKLMHLRDERLVVLGLPRGGVPVAFEVATAPGAPLDVMVVRKRQGATAFALAVAVTGCGGDSDTAASDSLRGRAFLSESVTEDGATRLLVAGTRICLQFSEDG